jgi:hypothetical protein
MIEKCFVKFEEPMAIGNAAVWQHIADNLPARVFFAGDCEN